MESAVKPKLTRTRVRRIVPRSPRSGASGISLADWDLQSDGRALRDEPTRPHVNPGLTAEGDPLSTKSRLRTIFLLPAGAFSEKRQVAKFDPVGKSFLTVILC